MGDRKGRRRYASGPKHELPIRVKQEERQFGDLERLTRSDPGAAIGVFSRLVTSTNESDRRTAAVCIDLLMLVRRDEALKLWHTLMADPEQWVRDVAYAMLAGAHDRGPEELAPNGIVLSEDEAGALTWEYYVAHQAHTSNEVGEPLGAAKAPIDYSSDDAPHADQPGSGHQSSTAWHDSILLKYLLGLEDAQGSYRDRYAAACRFGRVSWRYIEKHRGRLLWLLALRLWRRTTDQP